jgi:PAS domain S-box-containing protein
MKEYCTLLDPLLPLNSVYRSFGEELFRITFDCTSIGSAVIACDGRCLLANPALTGLLGYSLDELLGTDLRELIYAEDRSFEEPLARQMARGILSSYDVKHRYRHKDGHPIRALSYISLVQSGDLCKCRILQVQEIARSRPPPIIRGVLSRDPIIY